jgi:phosphonate transport system substrate-binding protein
VASGDADAAAVDFQVLEIELRRHSDLAERLKVVDELGPSTIQPVVAAARDRLDDGLVRRFSAVAASDYDDIRAMALMARGAGLEGFGPALCCARSSEERESG